MLSDAFKIDDRRGRALSRQRSWPAKAARTVEEVEWVGFAQPQAPAAFWSAKRLHVVAVIAKIAQRHLHLEDSIRS
eukprot:5059267-Pleurochrysis_carterae.AAC.3